MNTKGWTKVEHFHRAGSTASNDYGVRGVPHVVLVDGNGKIAFVGHPAALDLEKGIETLIKGEPLGKSAGGDDEEDGGYKAADVTAIRAEINRWDSKIKELADDKTLKDYAGSL